MVDFRKWYPWTCISDSHSQIKTKKKPTSKSSFYYAQISPHYVGRFPPFTLLLLSCFFFFASMHHHTRVSIKRHTTRNRLNHVFLFRAVPTWCLSSDLNATHLKRVVIQRPGVRGAQVCTVSLGNVMQQSSSKPLQVGFVKIVQLVDFCCCSSVGVLWLFFFLCL